VANQPWINVIYVQTPAWLRVKALRKQIKCRSDQFLRVFAKLAVEAGMIVRVHAAFEGHCLIGAIEELSRDAQSADPVTTGPTGTNLISLATHLVSLVTAN
jgi:hypothetical protein